MKVFMYKLFSCAVCAALMCSCAGLAAEAPKTENADPGLNAGTAASDFLVTPLPVTMDNTPERMSLTPRQPLEDMIMQTAVGTIDDLNLAIPSTFAITRPSSKLTTTYERYFITGTSNPDKPVYYGDNEITRLGTKGTFGVLVDLKIGANTFTFRQGDKTETVSITRNKYVAPESVQIKEITQSSMVPAVYSGVNTGEELDVGCVAPAGATVTAAFGGKSVTLKQVAVTEKTGIPAHFTGKILIEGDYEAGVTAKAGKVTYKMTYNGSTKTYESTGNVYVAGEGSRAAVRVTTYMGFVYPDTKDVSKFREKLKEGAADYIKSQDNTYVELASGGYVPKEQAEMIVGNVSISNKISKVTYSSNNKSESYTFAGTNAPAFLTKLGDGTFKFTLYNTKGSPSASVSSSKLFSGVSATSGDSSTTYTFTISNSSKLWGYNVAYDGTDTVLTFRYRPSIKSGSKPFEGMTIIVDPGHGGSDGGAYGVAGKTGPTEAMINLAHAYAARDVLSSMGANVILTRSQDTYYSLDDRLMDSEKLKADLFISLHHNSIAENADANKPAGIEMYYHTNMSKSFAGSMMSALATNLNRNNRFIEQSYYRVTLNSYCPAILAELGFMSNPLEYERATSKTQIKKVAEAIAAGIKQALS